MTDKQQVAYISGPMTGIDDFNYPLFNRVAFCLEQMGYKVFNPAMNDEEGLSWAEYMKIDLPLVCKSDMVYVLPGWEKSRGALLEVYVAGTLGIPVVAIEKILDEEDMNTSNKIADDWEYLEDENEPEYVSSCCAADVDEPTGKCMECGLPTTMVLDGE
jgi:hypothetical protein